MHELFNLSLKLDFLPSRFSLMTPLKARQGCAAAFLENQAVFQLNLSPLEKIYDNY